MGEQTSLEDGSSIWSFFTMSYLDTLFVSKAGNESIQQEDLGPLSRQDHCGPLFSRFENHWQAEVSLYPEAEKHKRSLIRVLMKTVGYNSVCSALLFFALYTAATFGPILILNLLVQHFDSTIQLSPAILWTLISLLLLLPMLGSVLAARSQCQLTHLGLAFRTVLINKIYRKCLVLSPSARTTSSTGTAYQCRYHSQLVVLFTDAM